jgi:hypothetical protein
MSNLDHLNPYVPGAGHPPPFLAGRAEDIEEFRKLLNQVRVVDNVILTGLRGVGKTVLLDQRFKTAAIDAGWMWVGSDLSESASVTEERLATRIITDLAVATEQIVISEREAFWQVTTSPARIRLGSSLLSAAYKRSGGLVSDKLKAVLEAAWESIKLHSPANRGVIFAYDEAQNMGDNAKAKEYPLSVLLEVFASLQKKGLPFMLVLAGLPTLFPKLVETRTYAERMFTTIFLDKLDEDESREAITKPLEKSAVTFTPGLIKQILRYSGGYPYFIQFICRETFDVVLQRRQVNNNGTVQLDSGALVEKLDRDFFQGRWAKLNDRQRDIVTMISQLPNASTEFSVKDVLESPAIDGVKKFSPSHATQMLNSLNKHGIVYRNRYGKYRFAVPLMADFVKRQGAICG